MKIHAQKSIWKGGIELAIYDNENVPAGKIAVAQPLVFEEQDQAIIPNNPTLNLDYKEAQMFMDELWTCGVRPSNGAGSTGELQATEKHLNDMRSLVASKLNVEL